MARRARSRAAVLLDRLAQPEPDTADFISALRLLCKADHGRGQPVEAGELEALRGRAREIYERTVASDLYATLAYFLASWLEPDLIALGNGPNELRAVLKWLRDRMGFTPLGERPVFLR